MVTVGILGLQGAIEEHEHMLGIAAIQLGITLEIRRLVLPEDLGGVDGIVMPGGESTAMILIGSKSGMLDAVRNTIAKGIPVFGTCAGAILLSNNVRKNESSQSSEGAFPFMDTEIIRNGYGRQKDSFQLPLKIENISGDFPGIFIRAPVIDNVGDDIEVLAEAFGKPILVKQGNLLSSSFHPELTEDSRIHQLFLKMILN